MEVLVRLGSEHSGNCLWADFYFTLTFREKDFPRAYYFLRLWGKTVFYLSGLKLDLKKEDTKQIGQNYIIISNHTSMMDIMIMYILNPHPMVFVGKKELLNLPIFGFIFKHVSIVVDRKDPRSRRKVFREAQQHLEKGRSICIFPEGGVPDESVFLDEFLDGPFAISVLNKVPMVIYTIYGLKEILPYSWYRGKPGTVKVCLNQIIPATQYGKKEIANFKSHCRDLIYNKLKEWEVG